MSQLWWEGVGLLLDIYSMFALVLQYLKPHLLGVPTDQSDAGSFIPVDIPQCT